MSHDLRHLHNLALAAILPIQESRAERILPFRPHLRIIPPRLFLDLDLLHQSPESLPCTTILHSTPHIIITKVSEHQICSIQTREADLLIPHRRLLRILDLYLYHRQPQAPYSEEETHISRLAIVHTEHTHRTIIICILGWFCNLRTNQKTKTGKRHPVIGTIGIGQVIGHHIRCSRFAGLHSTFLPK